MRGLFGTWLLTRERLKPVCSDLRRDQMLWFPYEGAHSIGEILYHVAGAEVYYAARVSGREPATAGLLGRLDRALVDGFLGPGPTPFGPEDMEPTSILNALELSASLIGPVLEGASEADLARPIVTGMGDHLTGFDGLVRVTQHAAYHTGQLWVYRMDPRFPD